MDDLNWSVDLDRQLLTHSSGLVLRFRGRPGSNQFGFNPEWIPQELTCMDLARLMRLGVEYYNQALESAPAQTLAKTA